MSAVLLERRETVFNAFSVPITGVPDTLLTLNIVPISKGTKALEIFALSLGLSKSIIVVPG